MNKTNFVELDGSYGEGGGQMIRTSLSLSAISQKPFRVFNIRQNRKPKPGLQPQHLMAVLAAQEITNGNVEGAELKASEFTFTPKAIKPGNYEFNIGTAGSVTLVAQTIIPILLTAKQSSVVRIIGGTAVPKSPSYDYFFNVFLRAIYKFSANVDCKLIGSGYFPKGNGEIELSIHPSPLRGNTQWPEEEKKPQAIIRIANLPKHIAEREQEILIKNQIQQIQIIEETTLSPGNTITIWQNYCGATQLGVRGKLAEVVAADVVNDFKKETATVDQHLADQLLLYTALAQGETIYKTSVITNHLLTNHYVLSHFIKRKIEIDHNSIHVY